MSKRIALTLFAVLTLALSACERSASTALPTANFPGPATASGNMQIIESAVTQTAVAQFGTPESGQGEMPTPLVMTPDPNVTQAPTVVSGENTSSMPDNPTPLPPVTSIPASGAGRPSAYTLQKGEFPFCIARRFNIDPDELLTLNGLSRSQSYFAPGTVLKIPQTGKGFPGERALIKHPATYTVLSGDTIYSIACKYGDVDPLSIAAQNGLQAPYTLTVGSQITIP